MPHQTVIAVDELANFVNQETLEVIRHLLEDDTSELGNYVVDQVNLGMNMLAKKHRYEVHGACAVLLGLVRAADLTIHPRAYNFLRAIEDKAYKE